MAFKGRRPVKINFRTTENFKVSQNKIIQIAILPALFFGKENWTFKARDARRIAVDETKYMRKKSGHTWTHYKTNTAIAKELKIAPALDNIQNHRRNWIQHVNRMLRNGLTRIIRKTTDQKADGTKADH